MILKTKWKVSPSEQGVRLVLFIKKKTESKLSNRLIKTALEMGLCSVNNRIETFASKKLKRDDFVEIEKAWENKLQDKNTPKALTVLYEDPYFKIIDKNSGFLCSDEEVEKHFPKCILVHRLDRQTSGVLILAKSQEIKDKCKILFKEKKVKKTYIAIVDGKIDVKNKKVESFLAKKQDSKGKVIWQEQDKGLFAVSIFNTIKSYNTYSIVQCFLVTGRTHQLRVHLKSLGHSILGDYQYCIDFKYKNYVPRLMLHNLEIEFDHPILDEKIKVKSPLPEEFKIFTKK
jgi:RluA family pseudouridine synthase